MSPNKIHIIYNRNFLLAFSLILFLSSCSSLNSLKFWGSDEVDPDEPAQLEDIKNLKTFNVNWKSSFSGDNFLGNFIPSFNAANIYFANSEGNVKSIDSSTGKILWDQEFGPLSSGVVSGFGIVYYCR
jgi:outer membrane protein assembly factor BamB